MSAREDLVARCNICSFESGAHLFPVRARVRAMTSKEAVALSVLPSKGPLKMVRDYLAAECRAFNNIKGSKPNALITEIRDLDGCRPGALQRRPQHAKVCVEAFCPPAAAPEWIKRIRAAVSELRLPRHEERAECLEDLHVPIST